MSNDTTPLKRCHKCGNEYPATGQFWGIYRGDILSSPCKRCIAKKKAQWRKNNPDKVKAQKRRSHANNRDKDLKRSRDWAIENREYIRQQWKEKYPQRAETKRMLSREWYKANRENVIARVTKYIRNNRDKARAWSEKSRLNHLPQRRAITRNYRARKQAAEGTHTADDILLMYEDQGGHCGYCGITLHDEYHVDHMIPLSRGGSNSPDNLIVACMLCNTSKGAKTIEEWEKERNI